MANTQSPDQDGDLKKGTQTGEQDKPDSTLPKTVTPDNDNGTPGEPASEDSSNKGQGPSGEDL